MGNFLITGKAKVIILTSYVKLNETMAIKKFQRSRLTFRERSGSVVECLTQDRGAAGLSLTGITVLCP